MDNEGNRDEDGEGDGEEVLVFRFGMQYRRANTWPS